MTDLLRIAESAARECVRQGVGIDRLGSLLVAYDRAWKLDSALRLPTAQALMGTDGLARLIERDNRGRFRSTPVSFADGSTAIPAANVPRAAIGWFGAADAVQAGDIPVDAWIKEFLDIHPFTDGNGRLAWLMRVWMLHQWEDPQPLPDYYGEATTGAPQARSIPDDRKDLP